MRGRPQKLTLLQVAEAAEIYKSGKTIDYVSGLFCVSAQTMRKMFKMHHVKTRKGGNGRVCKARYDTGVEDPQRQEKMRQLFVSGKTYSEVGERFGVSRQRVQQILRKIDVSASCGGASAAAKAKKELRDTERKKKRENRFRSSYGVTEKELREILNGYPDAAVRFEEQKSNARRRRIKWNLTIKEWIDIWSESGKYGKRGRHSHEYVLTRINGRGDFSSENCIISTLAESSRNWVNNNLHNRSDNNVYH